MKEKVTSFDIKQALALRHGNREFFITECKTGPTVPGMLQFDGLAIYKSWAHPKIVGYEIKISRSDFLRDNKFFNYLPYVHEFYFVVPTGLIDRMELPTEIGLIWYNPKTGALTTKKKAIYRNIEINANMLLYIIMNRLDSDRLPFTSDKTEYWQKWLDNKISDRDLGYQVSSKLVQKLKDQEHELRRLSDSKEEIEELNAMVKVMEKHGIRSYWKHAEALDKALSNEYPPELNDVLKNLTQATAQINKVIERSHKIAD